jgi:hypothetical protein
MKRVGAFFVSCWAFIADTAQILGVDWRQVLTFGAAMGGGTALIGLITEVGAFPLAIGAAAAGLCSSAAYALSQHRKAMKMQPQPARPATPRTLMARVKPGQPPVAAPAKPRYAPPADAAGIDITTVTYKELGKLMEAIGHDVQKFERSLPYNTTSEKRISEFHKRLSPHVLWVYGEAKRRGHEDSTIARFYRDPNQLQTDQIDWLAQSLVKMGAQLTLYFDA